jgi:protein ImuB
MLWACILFPELALDAVLRRHATPDQPLALLYGKAPRQMLYALNHAAARAGLQRGQALSTAQLYCPELIVVDYDLQATLRVKQFLAAWAYRYSSQVSVVFSGAIVLEVQHSFSALGQWPLLQAQLRAELQKLGFQHRIALAPNASAAWVLAGHEDGLALLSAHGVRQALASVPITHARLPQATASALAQMGLNTLGKVLALPRAALGQRYGAEVLTHLDRLLGQAPEVLPLYRPQDVFDATIELQCEVSSSQALLFPLRRLTADLAAYLLGRDGGVQRFVLHLAHADQADSQINIGLLSAVRDATQLFELSKERLERLSLPAPVRALRLLAKDLPAFVPAAQSLFDDRAQQTLSWQQLRERLRARLGEAALYGLSATQDHRPEQSWKRADAAVSAAVSSHALRTLPALSTRPTWLLARPIPLRDHALRLLAGPERIESGWWDGGDVQRDYYVIETHLGQHAWAFCAPGTVGPFMLHGWFA